MAQRKSNVETSEKDAPNGNKQGPSANTVTLIGRLTADAELRATSAGCLFHVEGRLQARTWEAADGSYRHTVEVVADRVQALSPKPSADKE